MSAPGIVSTDFGVTKKSLRQEAESAFYGKANLRGRPVQFSFAIVEFQDIDVRSTH